ncbi:unnamed protein product [marine sediment metagenome]|uniref:Uncharacterized protein n=1 Tax=marine sediment metagenome TaxID=412755 RepID=X1U451_9ZZZZ
MERLVQVKLFAKSLYHLRRKLGIQRVYLAGLARCKVDDQKRDNRDKEQGDDLLYDTATDERQHF